MMNFGFHLSAETHQAATAIHRANGESPPDIAGIALDPVGVVSGIIPDPIDAASRSAPWPGGRIFCSLL
jgi:hypothetical protein